MILLVATLAVLGGGWGLVNGMRTWQGREMPWVTRHLADPASREWWAIGGRTLYGTHLGVGAALVPGGFGLALMGVGVLAREVTGTDGSPRWWLALMAAAFVGVAIGSTYLMAYRVFGLPDRLRPPSQRGQPRMGQVGPDGHLHPLDALRGLPGHLDLGPDPSRPPWTRLGAMASLVPAAEACDHHHDDPGQGLS